MIITSSIYWLRFERSVENLPSALRNIPRLGLSSSNYKELSAYINLLKIQIKSTKNIIKKHDNEYMSTNTEVICFNIKLCKSYFNKITNIIKTPNSEEYKNLSNEIEKNKANFSRYIDDLAKFEVLDNAYDNYLKTYHHGKVSNEFIFKFILIKTQFLENTLKLNFPCDEETEKPTIIRSISFSPEFKQSGISILSYFSEIVSKKYPDIDVSVKIEQNKDKITLIIETPEGYIEKIEHELSEYGLVVIGQKTPEEYLDNKNEILQLKHKLQIAHLEATQTRDILYSERTNFEARVESLENQVLFLQKIFDKQQYNTYETVSTLNTIAQGSNSNLSTHVESLISIIEKGVSQNDKDKVLANLEYIKSESPSIFNKINDLILKGAIQGTAGNYLYTWIQAINIIA